MRHAQLKAFFAVARTGGFSRAAEKLGLTQPAVSDHVRKLELQYGVELFRREPEGAALTAIGRKLYAIAERQFESETQAIELLARARNLAEGQLTLGADAAIHALPLVARFRERFPGVDIRIVAGNSRALVEGLRNFSIDAAICADRPAEAGILAQRIARANLVAVVPRVRRKQPSITLQQLVSRTVILREEGSTTRAMLFAELQVRQLRLASGLEVESREAALEAVGHGMGVTVMPENEVPRSAEVSIVRFADWDVAMDEWLLVLAERAGLHVIEAFIGLAGVKPPR
ncbi:MAG: LysR substrate-binding domain-containing protein [Aestuariivirga sp.]